VGELHKEFDAKSKEVAEKKITEETAKKKI